MHERSFQEALGGVGFQHCWGCGVANEHGLHVTSYWSDDDGNEASCDWQAQPYHVASRATAYDRYYGVLKRLGASPLPR